MTRSNAPRAQHNGRRATFGGYAAKFATILIGLPAALTITAGIADAAPAPAGNCHVSNDLVKDMKVVRDTTDPKGQGFRVMLTPTEKLRNAIFGANNEFTVLRVPVVTDYTNQVWHEIQACQPGLYGGLADSIYQQLECHVIFGLAKEGPTYNFESRHKPLAHPGPIEYYHTACLNST